MRSSTKRRWAAGLVAALGCGLSAGSPAHAGIVVDNRFSAVRVIASAENRFGVNDAEDDSDRTASKTEPFIRSFRAVADALTASAEAGGGQNSSVTYTAGNLSGVSASGTVDVEAFGGEVGDVADAFATSEFVLRFKVPAGEAYTFTFRGNLAQVPGKTTAEVYLKEPARNEDIVYRDGNAGAFSASGELNPGTYELSGLLTGLAFEVSPGYGDAEFAFDLTLTPSAVPEPATATLLVLPAALLIRRHRRA